MDISVSIIPDENDGYHTVAVPLVAGGGFRADLMINNMTYHARRG